jgi:hypothetical protein
LCIDAVQLPHAEGEIPLRGLNKKVVMVRHKAVSVANPIIPFIDVLEGVQKILTVMVIFEDGPLFIAA